MNIENLQQELRDNTEFTVKLEERLTALETAPPWDPMVNTKTDDRLAEIISQFELLNKGLGERPKDFLTIKDAEALTMKLNEFTRLSEGVAGYYKLMQSKLTRVAFIGIAVLIAGIAPVVCCIILWRSNGELKAGQLKYRMIRQYYPGAAYWADTVYNHNPDQAATIVWELESKEEVGRDSVSAVEAQALHRRKGSHPSYKNKKGTVKK
jgi:hypothetical protein